jgi:protein MpaA
MWVWLASAVAVTLAGLLAAPVAGTNAARVDPTSRQHITLGRSVDGRVIVAIQTGDFDSSRRVLVVGCIHGDEAAGVAVADRLAQSPPPSELDLWIIPDLNPDGFAAGTRGNAHGVDLNRNFPWRWRRLGGVYYSGTRSLSEPESRIAYSLIRRREPVISVWFHQHLDVVDASGGSVAIERRFARLTGERLARLPREPGSAVGWENHQNPQTAAFVVELPAGDLGAHSVTRLSNAIVAIGRGR